MTQISGASTRNLVFEIISAKIEELQNEKKYVIYNLQVRHISGSDDRRPSLIGRRYTHFMDFYNSLKLEHPDLLLSVDFPKKVLMGNFDNSLISARSTAFENFLKHVEDNSVLRNSKSLMRFLQEPELTQAKALLEKEEYYLAYPILEELFLLLNKVFTDRSPVVLLCLCRLLGCVVFVPNTNPKKWAELTLHRYEGVSDSDLLSLYVPVMHICIDLGLYRENLERKLIELGKTGFASNKKFSLLKEVDLIESKIFNTH